MAEHTERKSLQLPLLHLNGSGKKNLEEQYREVWVAAYELKKALCQARPHMRDYYPIQNAGEAFQQARKQHENWEQVVDALLSDIQDMRLGIDDGGYASGNS
jgi:hypothetical protein